MRSVIFMLGMCFMLEFFKIDGLAICALIGILFVAFFYLDAWELNIKDKSA